MCLSGAFVAEDALDEDHFVGYVKADIDGERRSNDKTGTGDRNRRYSHTEWGRWILQVHLEAL